MSVKWTATVWERSQHKGSELLLMLALADSADHDTGTCYPGKATLARKMRMSERQVQRCIQSVIESGEVSVIAQGSHLGTNLYRLSPRLLRGGDKMSGETSTTAGGDIHDSKGESPVSPKPSVEPSDKTITPLPPTGGDKKKPRKVFTYTPEFEAWWKLYPSGRGIKIDAFEEWQLLSAEDQSDAMAALPAWVASQKWQTEPQYIPHAERWLKKRRWEGEPPPSAELDYTRIPNLTAPPEKVTRIDWDELLPDGTKRYIITDTQLIDRMRLRP